MHSRFSYFIHCMSFAFVILFVVFRGSLVWQRNSWSLNYIHYAVGENDEVSLPSPAILSSDSVTLWLARIALNNGNIAQAWTLTEPLINEGNVMALSILGDIQISEGNFDNAIQIWQKIYDISKIRQVALIATEQQQLDKALLAYQTLYQLEPEENVFPLVNLYWDKLGDQASAKGVLQQALATYPDSKYHTEWLQRLAYYERLLKQWDEAESAINQILEEDPNNSTAWIELGWIYYERGDGWESTQKAFRNAIAVDPNQGYGYFVIGQALSKEERYDEADDWFQEAILREPDNLNWQMVRAGNRRTEEEFILAIDLYRQIVSKSPDYAPAYYEMAWTYRLYEQPQEAMEAIVQALQKLGKPNTTYLLRAGYIFEWAENYKEAMGYFQQVLVEDPNNVNALNGIQQLAEKLESSH